MLFTKVPLCGWLWLFTLYSTAKPTFVGNPRLLYDPHISFPDGLGAMSAVGVPTPTTHSPFDPFRNPPRPPTYSPRAIVYAKTKPTSVAMPMLKPIKSAPQNPPPRSAISVISYVRRSVLQVFEQLTRPPIELSIGLVTTRSGNKLSAPSWAWKTPQLPLVITPTLTLYVHFAHTPTLDPASPASPTSGHGSRLGDPFGSIASNARGLGCWALFLVVSALTVVRRVLPLSRLVVNSAKRDGLATSPPALTALDWAPVVDSFFRSLSDEWFDELTKLVSIETKLAAHITVTGHPRRPLFYRANRTLFERHLISHHLESVMQWTLGEARRAAGNMDWYHDTRELGATVDVCVQVTTAELIVNKNEDQTGFINGRHHLQRSYCLSFELLPDAPKTPQRPPDIDLKWFLKGIDGRLEDPVLEDIQDNILADFSPPLAHSSPILAGCQVQSFPSISSSLSQQSSSRPHDAQASILTNQSGGLYQYLKQASTPLSQGIPPPREELSLSLSTGSFNPHSCSSPRRRSRVRNPNPSPESIRISCVSDILPQPFETMPTAEAVFNFERFGLPRLHLCNDEAATSSAPPLLSPPPLPPLPRLPSLRSLRPPPSLRPLPPLRPLPSLPQLTPLPPPPRCSTRFPLDRKITRSTPHRL